MLLTLLAGACSGEQGPAGPTGPEGPEGPAGAGTTPSISGIRPLSIFMEHEDTVLISGSATAWGPGTTIDFGPGVTVTSAVVGSPTAIVATVLADSSATLGPGDISVNDGVGTATLTGVFSVRTPLEVVEITGSFAPGSYADIRVRQLDGRTPFRSPSSAYFAELGIESDVTTVEPDGTLVAGFFLDLNTRPGPLTLVARSPDPGPAVTSRLGTPLTLPAPQVDALAIGVATSGSENQVYRVDAPAGRLVSVSLSNVTGAPLPFLIDPDSTFGGGSYASFFAPTSAAWFISVIGAFNAPASYDIVADTTSVTVTQVITPAIGGAISTVGEIDFYAIAVTAGEGLEVEIRDGATDTCAPAGAIDATIHLLAPDGRTLQIVGNDCPSITQGPVAAGGTYYVRVEAVPSSGATFDYELVLTKT